MDSPEKHEAVNAEKHTEHLEECTVEHTAELREILTEEQAASPDDCFAEALADCRLEEAESFDFVDEGWSCLRLARRTNISMRTPSISI